MGCPACTSSTDGVNRSYAIAARSIIIDAEQFAARVDTYTKHTFTHMQLTKPACAAALNPGMPFVLLDKQSLSVHTASFMKRFMKFLMLSIFLHTTTALLLYCNPYRIPQIPPSGFQRKSRWHLMSCSVGKLLSAAASCF